MDKLVTVIVMAEVTSDSWCSSSIFRAYKKGELSFSRDVRHFSLCWVVPKLLRSGPSRARRIGKASLRNHVRVCVTCSGVPSDQVFGERLTRLLVHPHHLLRLPLLLGGESMDSTASVWTTISTNAMSTSINSEYATVASLLLILAMSISIVYMMFMPGSHTMHISIVTNLLFFLD